MHKPTACACFFISLMHTHMQDCIQVIHTVYHAHRLYAFLPSPSLSLVLFPNLPDTRCFIFPHVKLAPKTFCGADYSIHKFAVKHFLYTQVMVRYMLFYCTGISCQNAEIEHIDIKSQYNALCVYHDSLDLAGSNDSASQIIGLMKCKKESVRVPFLYQIHIRSPCYIYHY